MIVYSRIIIAIIILVPLNKVTKGYRVERID